MMKDLPIWYVKKGVMQLHLPDELKCLHKDEKLFIQQNAVYVPLLYIQNGQIGSRGHVCSFEQYIFNVCTVLPGLPKNAYFVKVYRKY